MPAQGVGLTLAESGPHSFGPFPKVEIRLSSSIPRAALAAGLLFLVAGRAAAAPPPPTLDARDRVWTQSYSDLPADPDTRFGILPNGMRYAIRRSATPSGQTSLRLRIGSGSLQESDAEQGLAHFLEHLAFKGSTHVPGGDMIHILERHGLAFGADTNAQTEFTETVYQLDLPQSDHDSLGVGLMLLRDIGGELSLPTGPMDSERGVVLSEERLRDTPGYESFKAQFRFEHAGQLIADRLPIGKVDVIKSASPELVRQFYHANYRPDRATLVAVGDFDPAAMEAEIKDRYSDWRPVGPETAVPDYGKPAISGEAVKLYSASGAPPAMTLAWVAPFDTTPDSMAHEKHELIEEVAINALNRRFERLAHGQNPPFLAASASRSNEERAARTASLRILYRPADWRGALKAAVQAQREALRFGFSADEIAREVTELRVHFTDAAAGAGTRRTSDIANEIVRTADEQQVDTAPAEDLALFEQAVAGLTPQQVDAALAEAFGGAGPLLFVSSPEPLAGGETAVKAALDEAQAAPLVKPAEVAAGHWTHTSFGAPGRVVEQRTEADLGLTFVRFANGVRLTVKPASFSKDKIDIAVHFGAGRLGLPKTGVSPTWAIPAFTAGGLADLDDEALQQVFADRSVATGLHLDDDSYQMLGVTRPQDLDIQLQLLAAYMTAPGFRPEAFERRRQATAVALSQLDSTPEGVEGRDLALLERSGDPRWALPTPAQLSASSPGDLKALLEPALSEGPVEVIVAGDIAVPRAIEAVAATFGALPQRPPAPVAAGADQLRFPDPTSEPVVRRHKGRADQAIAVIAWPAVDQLSDPQRARVLNVMAQILEARLIDQVRIAEGATYSPAARTDLSRSFPGYGFLYGSVETPPDKLEHFYADVDAIAADMASRGVSADELERARRPRVQQILKSQQTNEYWVAMLHLAQTDPRRLQLIRETIDGYGRITTADVQQAAAAFLSKARSWRFEIEPERQATPAQLPASGGR